VERIYRSHPGASKCRDSRTSSDVLPPRHRKSLSSRTINRLTISTIHPQLSKSTGIATTKASGQTEERRSSCAHQTSLRCFGLPSPFRQARTSVPPVVSHIGQSTGVESGLTVDTKELVENTRSGAPSCPSSTIEDTAEDHRVFDEQARAPYYATKLRIPYTAGYSSFEQSVSTQKCRALITSVWSEARELKREESPQLPYAPYTLNGIHWTPHSGLTLRATFKPVKIDYSDYLQVAGPTGPLPSHTYAPAVTFFGGNQRIQRERHTFSAQVTHVKVLWYPQYFHVHEPDSGKVGQILIQSRLQQQLLLLAPLEDFLLWRNDVEVLNHDVRQQFHLRLKIDCEACSR
jgi:hypothetical protein